MGYDYDCLDGSMVLTHASAAKYHPDFSLTAAVDCSPEARKKFEKKFSAPAYETIAELFQKHSIEVVALSVPTEHHAACFEDILSFKPTAILCEKPLADGIESGRNMIESASRQGCVLAVNYNRRFDPVISDLKKKLDSGCLGEIYKAVIFYSKGLLNNGSHLIDLLFFLFGKFELANVISSGRTVDKDIEPDLHLVRPGLDAYVLSAREEHFSFITMEIVGTGGIVRYDGAEQVQIYMTARDPIYPDYTILETDCDISRTNVARSQWYVLEGLAKKLIDNVELLSTGKTAAAALQLIDDIRKNILSDEGQRRPSGL